MNKAYKMRWLVILLLSSVMNKMQIYAKRPGHYHLSIRRQQNQHTNISKLLDKLLENYDNSLRPDFGKKPAIVEIDLMVRSMGPVSEVEMTYSMDCYFRQSWIDRRLAFNSSSNVTTLALSISMLKKIWKPDTFFLNGKQSYLHTITTPNKFVRLFHDGRVLYSSRLTIKAACPMNLENFPMDVQRCPLQLGSFGYTVNDVLYRWNSRAVAISEDLRMSQFDLIQNPSSNESIRYGEEQVGKDKGPQEFSVLLVSFHLQRHMGNFLIQVYGPCILLVVLSWVSFWLNREATADRVSLGITTVLTMTFLGLEARTDLPKVSYPTALDFFVFLSFAFIFATILQFAVVHYFTKYGSGECYYNYYESSTDSESDEEETATYFPQTGTMTMSTRSHQSSLSQIDSVDMYGVIPLSRIELDVEDDTHSSLRKFIAKYLFCMALFSSDTQRRDGSDISIGESINESELHIASASSTVTQNTPCIQRKQMRRNLNAEAERQFSRRTFNSVSKIDKLSRVIFPLLFFFINLIYWVFYLSRSQRK